MPNRMTVSLPFSFKGALFRPSSTIDLDELMEKFGSLPCLYTYIADENGIDIYSYEHDVMMMAGIEFEDVEGFAADFIEKGHFDSEGFESEWKKRRQYERLQKIAERQMDITDLEAHPDLKAALLDAYREGQKEERSEKAMQNAAADPLL